MSAVLVLQEIIVLAENAKNETLLCPLCRGVFRDPYIATCGVSLGAITSCLCDHHPKPVVCAWEWHQGARLNLELMSSAKLL